jgi:hypothetical protein
VGKIVKEWGGLGTELFTSADKFSVEFPAGATAADKARRGASLHAKRRSKPAPALR